MATTPKTIYLNAKNGHSIGLFPCSTTAYVKETYTEKDLRGRCIKSRIVNLPTTRDGMSFHRTNDLFSYLVRTHNYAAVDVFKLKAERDTAKSEGVEAPA